MFVVFGSWLQNSLCRGGVWVGHCKINGFPALKRDFREFWKAPWKAPFESSLENSLEISLEISMDFLYLGGIYQFFQILWNLSRFLKFSLFLAPGYETPYALGPFGSEIVKLMDFLHLGGIFGNSGKLPGKLLLKAPWKTPWKSAWKTPWKSPWISCT